MCLRRWVSVLPLELRPVKAGRPLPWEYPPRCQIDLWGCRLWAGEAAAAEGRQFQSTIPQQLLATEGEHPLACQNARTDTPYVGSIKYSMSTTQSSTTSFLFINSFFIYTPISLLYDTRHSVIRASQTNSSSRARVPPTAESSWVHRRRRLRLKNPRLHLCRRRRRRRRCCHPLRLFC